MSFGNLNKMLDKTKSILKKSGLTKGDITQCNISIMKNTVMKELQTEYPDITYNVINELFNRIYQIKYEYNPMKFDNGMNCFREFEETYQDFEVPDEYKKLDAHFNKLLKLPQPAQRSKEWYDYRYNRITASDTAAAIDLNPYEPVEGFILKKCDPNFPFRDNATVFHGKKYEPTATMIYEHIYNSRVFEFGALPSEKHSILGASPDGICSKYTLDNKFSPRLGTMLEIKCPVTRDFHTHGEIAGEICPFYYYCQVQQQLACCELQKCDFWQCKILEYETRQQYLSDPCNDVSTTVGTNSEKITVDCRLKKGIILEFYPKNFVPEFDGDQAEWKSKYIIPKRLDMNEEQYDQWVVCTLDTYKTNYPEIYEKYYFNKIIYWKLHGSHNVTIDYDEKFMNSILPILEETWSKIVYYRKNQNKLDELKVIAEARKKYIKINTNYKISNNDIIKNKVLFLDNTNAVAVKKETVYKERDYTKPSTGSINKPVKKIYEKKKDVESDVEDFDCEFIDDDPKKKPIKEEVKKVTKIKHTEFAKPVTTKVKTKANDSDDCQFLD
jgi:putative phage-type endonuclease